MCDYLRTVRKEGAHGETFNTDVMTWVIARVTGHSFAQLLQERLWAPLGCEEDAYVILDRAGMPMAGGGLSACLRDVARFGELMRCEGVWNGKQLIPASVVQDVQRGDHPAKLPSSYSYRGQWVGDAQRTGRHRSSGHPRPAPLYRAEAEMVVSRFASHPVASADASDVITMPQMSALGRMLRA
ncbi:serine hydrolase [Mesorhizobium sp. M0140]